MLQVMNYLHAPSDELHTCDLHKAFSKFSILAGRTKSHSSGREDKNSSREN